MPKNSAELKEAAKIAKEVVKKMKDIYPELSEKIKKPLDFKKLIELGLISRKGKGKATYYILKEK